MRRPFICLAAILLLPPRLGAQGVPTGRIEGSIVDSVHAKPPAGGFVLLTRSSPEPSQFLSGLTDERGHYRFDSLSAGRYSIAFSTAFLDSLDLSLPPREIMLADGEHARMDFAIPSGATLRRAACPGLVLAAGQGAVAGYVADADTDKPLAAATIVVSWTDIAFDSAAKRVDTRGRTGAVTSDSLGQFRICGVPVDSWLLLQVQKGGLAGGVVRVSVPPDAGVYVIHMSLSAAAAAAEKERASSDSAAPKLTGRATVTGTVRGAGGQPLAGADVRVHDAAPSTNTDSSGRFTLGGLPAGTQALEVRKLGYLIGNESVELRSDRTATADVQLTRVVSLDSIRVIAQRVRYREFERTKRNNGFGRFLDEDQIAKRHAFDTADLLRMMPGVRLVGSGWDMKAVSSRGYSLHGACEMNVVIDGMQNQDINLISPTEIGALAVFPGSAGAPPFYDHGCGVIVIWTKR
jgi:hypothetical protein